MITHIITNKPTTTFKDLNQRDLFIYNSILYVKMDIAEFNAFSITHLEFTSINDDNEITKVKISKDIELEEI